jgi:hypothetical protein
LSTTRSAAQFSPTRNVIATSVAFACRRTLVSASCTIRSSTTSSAVGSSTLCPSTRYDPAIDVSSASRDSCRRIAWSSDPVPVSSEGISPATSARASVRFSRAVRAASARWARALSGSRSSSDSAACTSVTRLVNPCASVSWISAASRDRSAATPASIESLPTSSRLASSSLISAPRSSLCDTIRWIQVPTAMPNTVVNTVVAPNTVNIVAMPSRISTDSGGSRFTTTTTGMASHRSSDMKISGQAANNANDAVPSSAMATTISSTMPPTKSRGRHPSTREARITALPNARYQTAIVASTPTAVIFLGPGTSSSTSTSQLTATKPTAK